VGTLAFALLAYGATANGAVVSIADTAVTEGVSPTATFTVSIPASIATDVTFDFQTSDGTATAGDDYTATSGGGTITANTTETTISVPVANDGAYELTETFQVDVTVTSAGDTGGDTTAQGSINNDDAAPTLTINSPTVSEAAGTVTFTVTRTGLTELAASANFATSNGTAVAPGDYTADSGTVTVPANPGLTNTNTIPITIANDAIYETDETLTVALTGGTNATVGIPGAGTGTITNNDTAPVLTINSPAGVNEATGTISFIVTRTGLTEVAASANFATSNGTAVAPGDYTANSGTVTVPANTTTQTIPITIANETIYETNETFTVTLTGGTDASVGGTDTGTGTIVNDDAAPTLTIDSPTVSEATGSITFTVTRTGFTEVAASANFATSNGTAVAPGDYTADSGTVTVPANPGLTNTNTIPITIANDAIHETNETFTVTLTAPSNANVGAPGAGTGTITNDDAAPVLTMAPAPPGVSESAGVATFTVTRTGLTQLPASANYATTAGSAVTPGDFTASAAIVTVAADASPTAIQTFTVPVTNDTVYEGPIAEQFSATISLLANGNATIGATTTQFASITDDDPLPVVSIGNAAGVVEGGPSSFPISLTNGSAFPVSVTFTTINGTAPDAAAVANFDYAPQSAQVTIPATAPGAAPNLAGTAVVTTLDDPLDENDESYFVDISSPSGATLAATTRGTGVILDNDALPSLIIESVNVVEGNSGVTPATATVVLSPVSGRTASVNYATGLSGVGFDGTPDVDYVPKNGTLTFLPGETSKNVSVNAIGDLLIEGSETVGVRLSGQVNAALLAPPGDVGVILIADDDQTPIAPFAGPDTIVTPRDTPGAVAVLANDTDANDQFLGVSNNTDGAHGTASCTFLGICTYTPAPGYLGPDSFTYSVTDGILTTVGTVNVTVFRPNNAPVAKQDVLRTVRGYSHLVDVLANDADLQKDPLRIVRKTNGARGRVLCTGRTCRYTPTTPFVGTDSFTYTVSDGELQATGTVRVVVTARKPLRFRAAPASRVTRSGRTNRYAVTLINPNPVPVAVVGTNICLPTGFSSVGPTTGAIRVRPRVSACRPGIPRLTWTRRVVVPANGTATFRHVVRTGGRGLTRITLFGKTQTGFTIAPAGPTAAVTVTR
jgi:hypothetical protein